MNRPADIDIAQTVANALNSLDLDTLGHSHRVQILTTNIGMLMGLTSIELRNLSLGALLHDVGKQEVPQKILQKPGKLNEEEWEVIRNHPFYGWEFAKAAKLDPKIREIILNHHLWYNGQGGYPGEFNGMRPSLLAQITTVSDVLDAMTNDRPYRESLSLETSVDYLQEQSGRQFCPDVVETILENLDQIRILIEA